MFVQLIESTVLDGMQVTDKEVILMVKDQDNRNINIYIPKEQFKEVQEYVDVKEKQQLISGVKKYYKNHKM